MNKVKYRNLKTGQIRTVTVVQSRKLVEQSGTLTLARANRILTRGGYERAGSRA